ncbi:MAG: mannose-1-phosphate guanylyltransferase [Deltaproteobacteria bacterium]|nr:mannose-1-phosphate guanylyltransferase [Deltaproteobacteria bacterium]MBW2394779.1 mannose-1-phosphate guanylyltransferase [Deltaproteobacteria bacterium]
MSRTEGEIHAVVLAGGAGTRFWPLSRQAWPKPLLKVGSDRTLLEETLARAARYADRTWLICGKDHAAPMRKAAGLPASQVLVEPQMRNTAAAIAWAAHRITRASPDAVMTVLSADHRIPDGRAFASAMKRAARAAAREDVLVTLGVKPTRPETGYGYIRLGPEVGPEHKGLHRVARFVEKPDRRRARRWLAGGQHLWNAGIFAWRARVFLDELEATAPAIARALAPLGTSPLRGPAAARAVERAYRLVPPEPVDKAVLERSGRVWCLPVGFRWSDVGTWKSLAEEVGVGKNVTKVIDGEAYLCDSKGNLVRAGDRPVVLLGVSGLAVIDAGDALLVADLERSSDVRKVASLLREAGRSDLL